MALKFAFVITVLILSFVQTQASGLSQVRKIRSESEKGILVDAWIVRPEIKFGEDIILHYVVKNRSKKRSLW
jgi:hypothetical protein